MTWQRIDENTYIDDTLVTCAEYQLFIDEMREQGKYFQPDHWTSYQFPKGQAREPILGVRHSDAVAICEWLTQHKRDEWKYRLPNQQEAESYPIKSNRSEPVGYWVNKYEFVWIISVPNDVNFYNHEHLIRLASTVTNNIVVDLEHVLERSRGLARNLDLTTARVHELADDLSRNNEAANYLASTLRLNKNRSLDLEPISKLALFVAIELENELGAVPEDTRAIRYDYRLALDIYIDLYALRERIAGRSPAFEGIRLVKERIR